MNTKDKADELYKEFLVNIDTKKLNGAELEQIIMNSGRALVKQMMDESYKVDLIYYRAFRKEWQEVLVELAKLCKG